MSAAPRRVRLYEIYPGGAGFSTDTAHYHGESLTAAADQLTLPVDSAETEFRRGLEAQPTPEWMDVA